MLYYRFLLKTNENTFNDIDPDIYYTEAEIRQYRKEGLKGKYDDGTIESLNNKFYRDLSLNNDKVFWIFERTASTISVCSAVKVGAYSIEELCSDLRTYFPDLDVAETREITIEEFKQSIDMSSTFTYKKVLSLLHLDYRNGSFLDPCPYRWTEQVAEYTEVDKDECMKSADKILASKSLRDEIERIYSPENRKGYFGHPVHYYINAGDWGAAQDMYQLLIQALGSNGRLCSNRISIFRDFKRRAHFDERYRQHMNASEGGIVVLELCSDMEMSQYASSFHDFTKFTGGLIEDIKRDTLFIIVEIMGKSLMNRDATNNILCKADFISITEGSGSLAQSEEYLLQLADRSDINYDDRNEVVKCLPKKDSYSVTDIYRAYNKWYGSGLKNHIYKAYKTEDICKVEIVERKSNPYKELQRLIGLNDAKTVIDSVISAGKVRCMRESMGLENDDISLNMLFAGNPGTAKTTVARLIAQILKDENVVKSGKLVECGRQDLVARYVGWTAKTIEEKFKQADGGVLFIDEAYSLIDDHNSFGAEAINTITQLMENYRDRVIVIFAGYPDKMKTFLEQNEGLRSRIAFHLTFPDYTPDELFDILTLQAEKKGYGMPEEAASVCRSILSDAAAQENFGNGRYVRNLLEQAIIRQSERLIKKGGQLTVDDMKSLAVEDFKPVKLGIIDTKTIRMGFAV